MYAIQPASAKSIKKLSAGASPTPGAAPIHSVSGSSNEASVGLHDSIHSDLHSTHTAIIALRGEHDLASAEELKTAFANASRRRYVIVDLSRCTFIDSSVISVLLRASNELHAGGGQLSLVISRGGHRAVRTVFELMSLDRVMPTHETRAAALRHLDSTTSASNRPTATRLRALSEIIDFSLLESEEGRAA
jgi:anti-anti-sigma factor